VSKPPIDVTAKGAVLLGDQVACDGFVYGIPFRVQTHLHSDHMTGFDSSKGYQDIWMSLATKELVTAKYDADLPYRSNIHGLPVGQSRTIGTLTLEFLSSGHMLGAVQVAVTLADGTRVGYSSDFNWPLDEVIHVDALVLDSTYGTPNRRRRYSQHTVNERFVELVRSKVKEGPVSVRAHRGTIERALSLLDGQVGCPIVATGSLVREIEVYRRWGYGAGEVAATGSSVAEAVMAERSYLRLCSADDGDPSIERGTVITLSAYMSDPGDPVVEYSERAYRVAMSDHADFKGTLDYVHATGAKHVVTDNSRGGAGITLADELRRRLGIDARPSVNAPTREWGA